MYLPEDVQSFEKAVVNGATKSRRSQVQAQPKEDHSDDEDGDEDEDVPQKPCVGIGHPVGQMLC